ncbi:class I SAM-dependent methyltransferase [Cesiribacter andamanensis]|uniref:Glycine/sarcosine N-methyltransferase n=1 Tax=Cesiribacter andamanensis AMV16 TaxID=1279009 RepID=M7NQ17_9BACT|nr:class I SAM-dependent methyltransferase [Cesiribacter andamanensis]EMR00629.1 Glycine/sarcosine N-methyltransferase [Cesiribacter andamanensis AMV16]
MPTTKEWFGEWFNSPYYHILYKHRDQDEARFFINNLVAYFGFSPAHSLQDLACGKGRHSIYLNQLGFNVTGLDLSEQNIRYARRYANERLHFDVHDMRQVYREGAFDFILNLFTSFGYFAADLDNQRAVCAAARGLTPDGKLLLDFLNPYHVLNTLVPEEVRQVEGIEFHITRHLSGDGFIVKDIRFSDGGEQHHFQERVKAITYQNFLQYFKVAGLKLVETFGNYALDPYVEDQSDRMIFVLQNQPDQSRC